MSYNEDEYISKEVLINGSDNKHRSVVNTLKDFGIDNISCDFIYNLPNETYEDLLNIKKFLSKHKIKVIIVKMQKAPTFCVRKTAALGGDFGFGGCALFEWETKKAQLLFPKGKNGCALDMLCKGLRGWCPFSADGKAKRAPVCWLWNTNKLVP